MTVALSCSFTVDAQHTSPRYGTSPSSDATFRNQKLSFLEKTDAVGRDTIKIYPNSLVSNLDLTLRDTVCIYSSPVSAYQGDELTINISNTSGSSHTVFLTGAVGLPTAWEVGSGTTTISLTASKRAIIKFFFDGAVWLETSRVVQ